MSPWSTKILAFINYLSFSYCLLLYFECCCLAWRVSAPHNEEGAAQQLFFSDENRKELLELLGTDYISYESVSLGHFLLSLLGYFLASDNFWGHGKPSKGEDGYKYEWCNNEGV